MSEMGQNPNLPHRNIDGRFSSDSGHHRHRGWGGLGCRGPVGLTHLALAVPNEPISPRNFHCVYLVASTALVGRKNAYVPDRFPRAGISGGIHVSETGYHCGRCDDYRESSETGCRILREDALRDRAWDRVLSYKRKQKTEHEATNSRVQARLSIGSLRPTHASVAAKSFHRCCPRSAPQVGRRS